MSGIQTYWEKYRERNKSPAKGELIDSLLTNIQKDRISELQSQINIIEDRLVNLSRQVKLQQSEGFDIIETVSKINKIDKVLEIHEVLNKKSEDSLKVIESLANWEGKVMKMIENSEKKVVEFIVEKFEEFERKIRNIEEKVKKNSKTEDLISQQFEDIRTKIRKTSKSPEGLRKKIEEVAGVQEKLQKIVINTAEKMKLKEKSSSDLDSSHFSQAVEKIGSLLKKYSAAQQKLFEDVKFLQEKTKSIENKLETSRSFAVSEPVRNAPGNTSFEDNFKLSFGSEESSKSLRPPSQLRKKNS